MIKFTWADKRRIKKAARRARRERDAREFASQFTAIGPIEFEIEKPKRSGK